MNALWTLVPILISRFLVLGRIDAKALKRAAHAAPLPENEKPAYWIYQITQLLILVYPAFLKVKTNGLLFGLGLILYSAGNILYLIAVINFAVPDEDGINAKGLYRFSRNPMYVAFFIAFSGIALLTSSTGLFISLMIFQGSAHWIIRAEERWCVQEFGDKYLAYMARTKRYL